MLPFFNAPPLQERLSSQYVAICSQGVLMKNHRPDQPRRGFLGASLALVAGAIAPIPQVLAQPARLAPTPECKPGRATPPQTEGPFYSPRTPLKSNFRSDGPGEPMILQGTVLGTDCKPLAGAWVDFWHADSKG